MDSSGIEQLLQSFATSALGLDLGARIADVDLLPASHQEGNAKLIKQLETDAGAWHRARYLRRYLRAARRRLASENISVRYLETSIDFLAWADRYVEQLDPLSDAPRSEDFERPSNDYAGDEEKWKKGLARLVGSLWKDAWKVGKDYRVPRKASDDDD